MELTLPVLSIGFPVSLFKDKGTEKPLENPLEKALVKSSPGYPVVFQKK